MPNYRRYYEAGGTFFFTICLKDRTSTLLVDKIDNVMMALEKVKTKRPFHIHAYCILPDHLHLLLELPQGDTDYPTRIRLFKTHFTKAIGIPSPWQKRYWEHLIRNDKAFDQAVVYIHENPLKHGYVKRLEDWPYSSWHMTEY